MRGSTPSGPRRCEAGKGRRCLIPRVLTPKPWTLNPKHISGGYMAAVSVAITVLLTIFVQTERDLTLTRKHAEWSEALRGGQGS